MDKFISAKNHLRPASTGLFVIHLLEPISIFEATYVNNEWSLSVFFTTDPERVEHVMKRAKRWISNSRPIHFTDHLEISIANLLASKGIDFRHETQDNNQRLDFYLPAFDVHVEVKQYYTPRIESQLSNHDNVIAVQGKKSIEFLNQLLSGTD